MWVVNQVFRHKIRVTGCCELANKPSYSKHERFLDQLRVCNLLQIN
jgi:hypothetical protein